MSFMNLLTLRVNSGTVVKTGMIGFLADGGRQSPWLGSHGVIIPLALAKLTAVATAAIHSII